jgi:dolichyl-phosphate-mannose--protein O-mannosyl transferase
VFSRVGLDTPLDHRLASCLLGVAAVVVIGLAARRVAGDLAGLIAAGLAAVYPQLWINDGMLISESLYVLFIAFTLPFAYRVWHSDKWADAVILVPLLGIPLLCAKRARFLRRLGMVAVVGAACLVVILPRWVRNLTTFEDPTSSPRATAPC